MKVKQDAECKLHNSQDGNGGETSVSGEGVESRGRRSKQSGSAAWEAAGGPFGKGTANFFTKQPPRRLPPRPGRQVPSFDPSF